MTPKIISDNIYKKHFLVGDFMSFVRKNPAIVKNLPKQYAVPSSEEATFSASEAAIDKVLSSFKGKAILKSKYLKQIQQPFQNACTVWCHNADSSDINNRYKNLTTNVKNRIAKLPSVTITNNLLDTVKIDLNQAVAVYNKMVDKVKDWTPELCKECGVDLNDLSQTVADCSKSIDSAVSLCKSASSAWGDRLQVSSRALNQCKVADRKIAEASSNIKASSQIKRDYMAEVKKYPNIAEFRQSELLRYYGKINQAGHIKIELLELNSLESLQKLLSTQEIPQMPFFNNHLFKKFPYIKRLFDIGDAEKTGWALAGKKIKKVVSLIIAKLKQQDDTVFLQKIKQASSGGDSIDKLQNLLKLCKAPQSEKALQALITAYTGVSYWYYNGIPRGCYTIKGNPFMTQLQEVEKLHEDKLIEPELWSAMVLEIRKLQKGITANKTIKPMTVWRRVPYDTCRSIIFKSKFPNLVDIYKDKSDDTRKKFQEQMKQIAASHFTIIDPGFLSTTIKPGGIKLFGNVLLTIDVPAGTPGIDVSKCSKHPNEKEILFPKAIKCQIQSVASTFSDGSTVVEFNCKFVN